MSRHGYRPPVLNRQDNWIYLPTNPPGFIPAGRSQNHRGQTRDPWWLFEERPWRDNNYGLTSLPSQAPIPLLVIEEYHTYPGSVPTPVAPTSPAYYSRGEEESRLSPEEQKRALYKLRKHLYSPHINSIINRLGTKSSNSSRPAGGPSQDDNGARRCAVCLDDFESKQFVTMTPCNHMFHEDCIVPWVKSHGKCPVCRFVIF